MTCLHHRRAIFHRSKPSRTAIAPSAHTHRTQTDAKMIAAAHTVTVRPAAALSARRGYVPPPRARRLRRLSGRPLLDEMKSG